MERIIFHVDVNNAFLSWTAVDLLKNGYPTDIRTIPSVIGGDEKLRHGIVLAKSPIAKKYGIKTAETLYSARKKCPKLEVFPANYDLYLENSRNFYQHLKKYTPYVEQTSVDECFMDLSNTSYLYDDILKLAYKIKNEIKENYGYTVNIGIANNKLCAKMASDFLKPDKVHTLFSHEIKDKMWPLPISDLLYVGKSSSEILSKIGINTIGELAQADERKLKKYFKSRSSELIKMANGIDDSIVDISAYQYKCISISRTLPEDTSDERKLKKVLLDMANSLGLRARKKGLYANVVAITVKTSSFRSFSHQIKLDKAINNTMDIYNNILKLFKEIDKSEKIRSIGIRLGDLVDKKNEQVSLFDGKEDDTLQKLMDDINIKYQNTAIMPAIFYEDRRDK